MDRVSSAGFQTIDGRRTWQNMNLGSGIQGTTFDQLWFAGVQESIIGVVEALGIAPADQTLGNPDLQLFQATARLAGANVMTILAGTTVLTPDNAGWLYIDASGGNIAITLPASASAGGRPLVFHLYRSDISGNSVTVNLASGDTEGISDNPGPFTIAPIARLALIGGGDTHWMLLAGPGVAVFAAAGTHNFTVPPGVILVEADVTGGGGGSGANATGQGAGGGGGAGNAIKNCPVYPGQVVSVTTGNGGAGGISGPGGNGLTSSFGSYCSATGGAGGGQSSSGAAAGGTPGVGSGGDINSYGGDGGDGQTSSGLSFGGGGGGSRWGGGGRGGSGVGMSGRAPGSGAGGPYAVASNGSAGAIGIVIVRWGKQ